ncbi:MAG: hypothetical protein M3O22_03655 [Pseudomonadota bacterium]|nr:hypothetical protein [Pseudomonadota bacterium]
MEDCLESGKSLDFARNLLIGHAITVRTAAVFVLKDAIAPDYAVETLATVPRFPWE